MAPPSRQSSSAIPPPPPLGPPPSSTSPPPPGRHLPTCSAPPGCLSQSPFPSSLTTLFLGVLDSSRLPSAEAAITNMPLALRPRKSNLVC
ncbi:unnamed protein product [Linum trigynum]|uniref:Uncharacterized protein n=1 Tax=Linum trigynum TaxID=586398 RepID=A0AAV2CUM0_9ROSI